MSFWNLTIKKSLIIKQLLGYCVLIWWLIWWELSVGICYLRRAIKIDLFFIWTKFLLNLNKCQKLTLSSRQCHGNLINNNTKRQHIKPTLLPGDYFLLQYLFLKINQYVSSFPFLCSNMYALTHYIIKCLILKNFR